MKISDTIPFLKEPPPFNPPPPPRPPAPPFILLTTPFLWEKSELPFLQTSQNLPFIKGDSNYSDFFDFLSKSEWDAPFHHMAYDYSCVD